MGTKGGISVEETGGVSVGGGEDGSRRRTPVSSLGRGGSRKERTCLLSKGHLDEKLFGEGLKVERRRREKLR